MIEYNTKFLRIMSVYDLISLLTRLGVIDNKYFSSLEKDKIARHLEKQLSLEEE